MAKVEHVSDAYRVRVIIDGYPHIAVQDDLIAGVHSWEEPETHQWFIEFHFTGKAEKMRCEYDKRELWLAVLGALKEAGL